MSETLADYFDRTKGDKQRSLRKLGHKETKTYTVFAFNAAEDPPVRDQRRHGIPDWRLPEAVRWAVRRGFDTILIQQSNEPASMDRLSIHHVCSDAWCPGGCE